MSSNKKQAKKQDNSMSRQGKLDEELVRSIEKQLAEYKTNEMYRRGKPVRWNQLTEAERKALEKEEDEANRKLVRERELFPVKQRLQSLIQEECASPNSPLYTKAKEILGFVVKLENDPSSGSDDKWNRLFSILLPELKALVKAKYESEKERDTTPAKHQGIWTRLKNHPHSYGLIGSVIFLIFFFVLGLVKAQWSNWCWGTAIVPLLVLILSLLGGRSSR